MHQKLGKMPYNRLLFCVIRPSIIWYPARYQVEYGLAPANLVSFPIPTNISLLSSSVF